MAYACCIKIYIHVQLFAWWKYCNLLNFANVNIFKEKQENFLKPSFFDFLYGDSYLNYFLRLVNGYFKIKRFLFFMKMSNKCANQTNNKRIQCCILRQICRIGELVSCLTKYNPSISTAVAILIITDENLFHKIVQKTTKFCALNMFISD